MRFVFPFLPFLLISFVSFTLIAVEPEPPDGDSCYDTRYSNQAIDSVKYWKLTINGRLNLSQVAFTNWAEGGESSVAANSFGNLKANYLKGQFKFDNYMALGYGMTWNDEQGIRKTDDRIDVGTTVGYEAWEDWFYSFLLHLKTQFNPGFKYPNDSVKVSDFFSPATLYTSLGMEYKPDENTSIFISPASGKFIVVLDQGLADNGAFGVTPAQTDSSGQVLVPGLNYRSDFGFNLVFNLDRELMKNVNMETRLNLHNNYMDESFANRWNFDVDWETAVNFKINHFLSSMVYLHLMYDDDILLPTYETVQGEKIQTGQGPKLQVKENFGIGLMLKV